MSPRAAAPARRFSLRVFRRIARRSRRAAAATVPCLVAVATLAVTTAAGAAEKLTITYRNEVTSADLLIALDEGFFADEGIEIEVVPWNSSGTMLPALAQGKLDIGISGPIGPAYFNVAHRGGRVRLVRARSLHGAGHCPYAAYVARNELIDSGRLSSVASIRGLRISTDRTSASLFFWQRLLAQGGLTIDDVQIMDMPAEARAVAFARGLIDVVELTEPRVYAAVSAGHGKVWKGFNDAAPDHQNTFLMFGPKLLDSRRDLGLRVVRAISRASRQYVEDGKSDRNVEIISRHTRMEPEAVRQVCWPQWSADGRIDPRGLRELQEWSVKEGLGDAVVPFDRLVDESFLLDADADAPDTGKAPQESK